MAETILEGINEIEKIEAVLKEPKHMDPTEVFDYDVILIGSPNHVGGPTRGIKKFIDELDACNRVGREKGSRLRHIHGKRFQQNRTKNGKKNKRKGSRPESDNPWPVNKG